MMNSLSEDSLTDLIMPSVDLTASAMSSTSGRHSGWAITLALGWGSFSFITWAGVTELCVGQNPGQRMISLSWTHLCTHFPRFSSGTKITSLDLREDTTF